MVKKGSCAWEEKVIESEVEGGGKRLAEGNKSGSYTNDPTYEDIIPMMDWERSIIYLWKGRRTYIHRL